MEKRLDNNCMVAVSRFNRLCAFDADEFHSYDLVPNMVILLIDDDPDDVFFVDKALRRMSGKIHIQVVWDGSEAISYLNGTGMYADRTKYPFPTLVILDLRLPGKDGIEILRWIRKESSFTGLPVVILSGSESPKDKTAAWQLHVNSYLTKSPLLELPDILSTTLDYWIRFNQNPDLDSPADSSLN